MNKVCIESPFAGNVARNEQYAREAMLDSLERGEAPFLSHLLYTQVLDDEMPDERALGIAAGDAWAGAADVAAIYGDLGISEGMRVRCERFAASGKPLLLRSLSERKRDYLVALASWVKGDVFLFGIDADGNSLAASAQGDLTRVFTAERALACSRLVKEPATFLLNYLKRTPVSRLFEDADALGPSDAVEQLIRGAARGITGKAADEVFRAVARDLAIRGREAGSEDLFTFFLRSARKVL